MSTALKRYTYIDIIRIISCLGIVIVHSTSVYAHAATPFLYMFFGISGAVWLNRERPVTIKSIFKGNILKLFVSFVFWSVIYDLYLNIFLPIYEGGIVDPINAAIALVVGPFHFWFIYVLLGIYLAMPGLWIISKDKAVLRYITILMTVFAGIIPGFQTGILEWTKTVTDFIGWSGFEYVYYFFVGGVVAGLDDSVINKRWKVALVALVNILMYILYYINYPFGFDRLINALYVGTFILLMKAVCNYLEQRFKFNYKLINYLSGLTFGVYCVHVLWSLLFRITLDKWVFSHISDNPYVVEPFRYLLVLGISFLIVGVIKKIPVLGRWVV